MDEGSMMLCWRRRIGVGDGGGIAPEPMTRQTAAGGVSETCSPPISVAHAQAATSCLSNCQCFVSPEHQALFRGDVV